MILKEKMPKKWHPGECEKCPFNNPCASEEPKVCPLAIASPLSEVHLRNGIPWVKKEAP